MYLWHLPIEMFVVIAGIFGASIGSFLHVCIWRIPREESIVFPRSHCPACNHEIHWYDNLPLLSYLWLRGACRYCEERIPIRYPIYEMLTALCFMGIVYQYHITATAFLYLFLVCVMMVASGIDWDHQYIPDFLSVPMMPLALIVALVAQSTSWFSTALVQDIGSCLLGIIVGGGVIWLIRIVGTWVFRQEAMGFGDVKLMGFLGGFIGWDQALLCIVLASFTGSIVGVSLKLTGKIGKYGHIPFGPYLAFGAYICMLYGPEIIAWYTSPFRIDYP